MHQIIKRANGGIIDALDNYGQSALFVAALTLANESANVPNLRQWREIQNHNPTGRAAVVEILILAGADIHLTPKNAQSPEHFIRSAGVQRHLSLLKERAKGQPKQRFWSKLFGT